MPKNSDVNVYKVKMGRYKVHGKTIQYRELDDDGNCIEKTQEARIGPIYVTKDAFDNEKGPKQIIVKLVYK